MSGQRTAPAKSQIGSCTVLLLVILNWLESTFMNCQLLSSCCKLLPLITFGLSSLEVGRKCGPRNDDSTSTGATGHVSADRASENGNEYQVLNRLHDDLPRSNFVRHRVGKSVHKRLPNILQPSHKRNVDSPLVRKQLFR